MKGGFHKYDLDWMNEECYGVDYPPEYYPANANVPISLYWGQNDWLADPSVSVQSTFIVITFAIEKYSL